MIARQKELRGKILSFLAYVYPGIVEEMSIVRIFYEYHEVPDIRRALEYLADKGYIHRNERPHPYRDGEQIRLYKISPEGMDLKEGTLKDPGVIVVE